MAEEIWTPPADAVENKEESFTPPSDAIEGEKKNTILATPSNSGDGISKSMAEAVGFGAPSISKIKEKNIDTSRLHASKVAVDMFEKTLKENPSESYRDSYINALAKKGYDKNALLQIADNLKNKPAVEDSTIDLSKQDESNPTPTEAEIAHSKQQQSEGINSWENSGVGKVLSVVPNTFMNSLTGASQGLEQINKGFNTLGDKVVETHGEYAKEPLSTKLKDVGAGFLNVGAGTLKTFFSGASLVVPELAGFNVAIGEAEQLPESAKASVTKYLFNEGLDVGTEKQNAEKFDKMLTLPFTMASSIAHHMGYDPKEGSGKKAALEIADALFVIVAMKGGKEVKNLSTPIDYTSAMNELGKTGGVADAKQVEGIKKVNDIIQNTSLQEIKDELEKKAVSNVPHNELHDKLATLQADQEKLPDADKHLLDDKIKSVQNEIDTKTEQGVIAHTEEAKAIAFQEDIKNQIVELESKKEGLSDEGKKVIDENIDELKLQIPPPEKLTVDESDELEILSQAKDEGNITKEENVRLTELKTKQDAISQQGTSSLFQQPQERVGETGSQRQRVEQSKQGNEITQEGETVKGETQNVNSPEKDAFVNSKIEELKNDTEADFDESNLPVYQKYFEKQYDKQNSVKEVPVVEKTPEEKSDLHDKAQRLLERYNSLNAKDKKGAIGLVIKNDLHGTTGEIGYSLKPRAKGRFTLVNEKGKEVKRAGTIRPKDVIGREKLEKAREKRALNAIPISIEHAVAMDVANGVKFDHEELKSVTGLRDNEIPLGLTKKGGKRLEHYKNDIAERGGASDEDLNKSDMEYTSQVGEAVASYATKGGREMAKDFAMEHQERLENGGFTNAEMKDYAEQRGYEIEQEDFDHFGEHLSEMSNEEILKLEKELDEKADAESSPEIINQILKENGIEEENFRGKKEDIVSNDEGGRQEESGQETAGQVKAQKEYDSELSDLDDKLTSAKKSRDNKLAELNSKVDLFGGKGKEENKLFDEEQDQSPEAIKKVMQPYEDKVKNAEKEKSDFEKNKDNFLKKYDNQTEISSDTKTESASGVVKNNYRGFDIATKELDKDHYVSYGEDAEGNRVSAESKTTDPVSSMEKIQELIDSHHSNLKAEKAKVLADKIRKGKIGGAMSAPPLLKEAWNTAVEIIAKAVETGGELVGAIEKGIASIKASEYYKSKTDSGKALLEKKFRDSMEKNYAEEKAKEEKPKLTGISKDALSQERIDKGLNDAARKTVFKNPEIWQDVVKGISEGKINPKEVIADILAGDRPISVKDEHILIYEKTKLNLKQDEIFDKLKDARKEGDKMSELGLLLENEQIESQQIDVINAAKITGEKWSDIGQARQHGSSDEFEYVRLKQEIEAEQGHPLTKEQEAKFKELSDQYKEVERKNRELQKQIDLHETSEDKVRGQKFIDDMIKEGVEKGVEEENKKIAEQIFGKETKAKVDKVFDDILNSLEGKAFGSIIPLPVLKAAVKIVKQFVDRGMDLANAIQKGIQHIKDNHKEKFDEKIFSDLFGGLKEHVKENREDKVKKEEGKISRGELRKHIKKGVKDFDEMVEKVHADHPEMSKEEVAKEISGYGKKTELSKDEVSKQLRELKEEGRLKLGIKDVMEGKLPEKSGLQKDKATDKIAGLREELRKAVYEATPKFDELSPEQKEAKFKSAMESYKSRLNKQIDNLQKRIDTKDYTTVPRKKLELDAQAKELKVQKQKLVNKINLEKEKIRLKNLGTMEKTIRGLSKLQRFMIFLNPFGMLKLTVAATFRPLLKTPTEIAKLALSNLPISKGVFEKSSSQYTPNVETVGKSLKDYYTTLFAKETFKEAGREMMGGSNFKLLHGGDKEVGSTSKLGKFLDIPQKTHGVIKTGVKLAEYKSAYEKALKNLSNEIDPKTGKNYDITNPETQSLADHLAEVDALSDVFMQDSKISKIIRGALQQGSTSESAMVQAMSLIASQQMPVIKVPQNFYHELFQKIPLAGTIEALTIIKRSGEKGGERGGIKNLTPEQAQKASKAITNQLVGVMAIAIGKGLYDYYGDDAKKKLMENHYYLHNPFFRLIQIGIDQSIESKEGIGPIKAMAGLSIEATKEGLTDTPQIKTAIEISRILKTEYGLSEKAANMAATLLVPAGVAEIARRMDKAKKRDPKTFKEILESKIPGLRELVPQKHITTVDEIKEKLLNKKLSLKGIGH